MWIFDSAYRDDGIDLWTKDRGNVSRVHHAYNPPFYVRFHDPALHYEMISALEERYEAKECAIRTIFGELSGYAVYGGRDIAEAIERQAQCCVDLFNVDVRRDQRFMAEHSLFPCVGEGDDRFSPQISHDLTVMEVSIHGNAALLPAPSDITVTCERTDRLTGPAKIVLSDLFDLVESFNPDVLLMTDADVWMPKIRALAQKECLEMNISRNGRYRKMSSRSYWSYGRMEHKEAALIPDGRILIDTEQSFVYREGGLPGVLMASRLSGLPPNLASRLTPGTLISSYEIYEAVRQGIVVPFRKSDPEQVRKMWELMDADRGGMMYQPNPGIYENVEEIDYTSMYPSIIVQSNLSPETVGHQERQGFLPTVLKPLLDLRVTTKRLKKTDPALTGTDAILKWMLVTCFGYTGYRNAKFGRIEVHEGITGRSREILIQTKDIAESLNFRVLHGIVDCLWVQGAPIEALKEKVENETGLLLEVEHFDWIVFLPLNDGFGAYNRYYGRQPDGSIKVRGIAARRHDTPEFVRNMQQQMLEVMARAKTLSEVFALKGEVESIFRKTVETLPTADPQQMVINRRISRLTYAHRCIEGAAVQAYRDHKVDIAPGMKIQYVVTDAKRYRVEPAWCATTFDTVYYRGLIDKAREEIVYAFGRV
ncbi:type B DNA-directed DNA polymerase [Methanoregula sp. UBA64]|uniref:type B DNA-directed DNA polymerase n=1 Tax=Methanoregula sp. UBA64 TaxID=1915554 RepID=UPI0025CF4CFD|nr:type B DNA-directed DNA polymerase [Methanoregula sp. UBA64]